MERSPCEFLRTLCACNDGCHIRVVQHSCLAAVKLARRLLRVRGFSFATSGYAPTRSWPGPRIVPPSSRSRCGCTISMAKVSGPMKPSPSRWPVTPSPRSPPARLPTTPRRRSTISSCMRGARCLATRPPPPGTSVIAGVIAVLFVYLAAVPLIGRPAALVAAAIHALSPFLVAYSQEARQYSSCRACRQLRLPP